MGTEPLLCKEGLKILLDFGLAFVRDNTTTTTTTTTTINVNDDVVLAALQCLHNGIFRNASALKALADVDGARRLVTGAAAAAAEAMTIAAAGAAAGAAAATTATEGEKEVSLEATTATSISHATQRQLFQLTYIFLGMYPPALPDARAAGAVNAYTTLLNAYVCVKPGVPLDPEAVPVVEEALKLLFLVTNKHWSSASTQPKPLLIGHRSSSVKDSAAPSSSCPSSPASITATVVTEFAAVAPALRMLLQTQLELHTNLCRRAAQVLINAPPYCIPLLFRINEEELSAAVTEIIAVAEAEAAIVRKAETEAEEYSSPRVEITERHWDPDRPGEEVTKTTVVHGSISGNDGNGGSGGERGERGGAENESEMEEEEEEVVDAINTAAKESGAAVATAAKSTLESAAATATASGGGSGGGGSSGRVSILGADSVPDTTATPTGAGAAVEAAKGPKQLSLLTEQELELCDAFLGLLKVELEAFEVSDAGGVVGAAAGAAASHARFSGGVGNAAAIEPLFAALRVVIISSKQLRRFFKARVLVPRTDFTVGPEVGSSLRAYLVRLMTHNNTAVKTMAADFLFALCNRNPRRLVKQVGYGHAAGFLTDLGLAAGFPTTQTEDKQGSSCSSSEAESESESESEGEGEEEEEEVIDATTINPVTARRWEGPPPGGSSSSNGGGGGDKQDDLGFVSEEHKEHAAVELMGLIDRLNKTGVMRMEMPTTSN